MGKKPSKSRGIGKDKKVEEIDLYGVFFSGNGDGNYPSKGKRAYSGPGVDIVEAMRLSEGLAADTYIEKVN